MVPGSLILYNKDCSSFVNFIEEIGLFGVKKVQSTLILHDWLYEVTYNNVKIINLMMIEWCIIDVILKEK